MNLLPLPSPCSPAGVPYIERDALNAPQPSLPRSIGKHAQHGFSSAQPVQCVEGFTQAMLALRRLQVHPCQSS